MDLNLMSQIAISILGGTAMWMMNGRTEKWRRRGIICGLAGQPFWYIQLVIHSQWLMFPVYGLYTASWLRGLWLHWIKKAKESPCPAP